MRLPSALPNYVCSPASEGRLAISHTLGLVFHIFLLRSTDHIICIDSSLEFSSTTATGLASFLLTPKTNLCCIPYRQLPGPACLLYRAS